MEKFQMKLLLILRKKYLYVKLKIRNLHLEKVIFNFIIILNYKITLIISFILIIIYFVF